jgi:hypothetical protein
MRDVRRAVVAGRQAVEDCAAEATIQVRRHPFVSLGIAASVGTLFGCLIGFTAALAVVACSHTRRAATRAAMAEPVARGVVRSGEVASVTINQERVRGTLKEADQRTVGAIGGDKFELPRSFPPRMTRLSAIVRAICRRVVVSIGTMFAAVPMEP